jgi:hypothetical protein
MGRVVISRIFAFGEGPADPRLYPTPLLECDRDIGLHLTGVKAYQSGMVKLCYDVRGHGGESRHTT